MKPNEEQVRLHRELTVGQVAARSGVAVSTLHFYEAQGLIKSWRNPGNQRRYAREALRRVAVIKVAQRTGIPLAAIRKALKCLPGERTPTSADWKKLSAAWRSDLKSPHQPPDPPPRPTHRLHRLRLPLPRSLPPPQSPRHPGQTRPRPKNPDPRATQRLLGPMDSPKPFVLIAIREC